MDTRVEAGETAPFWPVHGAARVRIRVRSCSGGTGSGPVSETEAFSLQEARSTLLRLTSSKYGGLHAEVRKSDTEILLSISGYKRGKAPVQLVSMTLMREVPGVVTTIKV